MQTTLLRLCVSLARGWTRLYTWRAVGLEGSDRRREIESDLWELTNDPDAGSDAAKATQALARLVTGLAADISWRLELPGSDDHLRIRRTVTVMAAMLVVFTLWIVPSFLSLGLRGRAQVVDCAAAAPTPSLRHTRSRPLGSPRTYFA